jgi:beta-lactamase regulating signal transducer with metallopeptidase domain
MIAIDFQTLAQASAGRVLNTIVEGVALAGLSWLVLQLVGGRSAVTRFAVWFSTLLTVVSLPLLVRASSSGSWRTPELELSSAWAKDLFIVWASIASVLLIRLAASLWHVLRLQCECCEIAPPEHPELLEALKQCPMGREVKLLVSDEVQVPTAIGFFRPAVVLPAWALHELSSEELKIIVLHELAHLRRWDDWTNLAQKFLKAVFFFHPAVWWIEGRLALEREMACDDMVLEQTANPAGYAASLVSIAEKVFAEKTRLRRALALAQGALGQMRQSSLRIAQILDPRRSRSNGGWRPAVAAVAGVVVVAFVATPYAPEIISFQQRPVSSAGTRMSSGRALSSPALLSNESPVHAIRASAKIPAGRITAPVIRARVNLRHVARPSLVLAKANVEQRPAQMLLVVQSVDFDLSGSLVWRLCIWRVNPGDQGARQIEETIVMHSI